MAFSAPYISLLVRRYLASVFDWKSIGFLGLAALSAGKVNNSQINYFSNRAKKFIAISALAWIIRKRRNQIRERVRKLRSEHACIENLLLYNSKKLAQLFSGKRLKNTIIALKTFLHLDQLDPQYTIEFVPKHLGNYEPSLEIEFLKLALKNDFSYENVIQKLTPYSAASYIGLKRLLSEKINVKETWGRWYVVLLGCLKIRLGMDLFPSEAWEILDIIEELLGLVSSYSLIEGYINKIWKRILSRFRDDIKAIISLIGLILRIISPPCKMNSNRKKDFLTWIFSNFCPTKKEILIVDSLYVLEAKTLGHALLSYSGIVSAENYEKFLKLLVMLSTNANMHLLIYILASLREITYRNDLPTNEKVYYSFLSYIPENMLKRELSLTPHLLPLLNSSKMSLRIISLYLLPTYIIQMSLYGSNFLKNNLKGFLANKNFDEVLENLSIFSILAYTVFKLVKGVIEKKDIDVLDFARLKEIISDNIQKFAIVENEAKIVIKSLDLWLKNMKKKNFIHINTIALSVILVHKYIDEIASFKPNIITENSLRIFIKDKIRKTYGKVSYDENFLIYIVNALLKRLYRP